MDNCKSKLPLKTEALYLITVATWETNTFALNHCAAPNGHFRFQMPWGKFLNTKETDIQKL